MKTHESDIIIPQCKPGKDEVEHLIDELDVDEEFPAKGMIGAIDVSEFSD